MEKSSQTHLIHVISLKIPELTIYPIEDPLLAGLQLIQVPGEIFPEYTEYANVFSHKLAMKLTENTGINEHAIKMITSGKSPYDSIYCFATVELETVKF